ncbi:MAG: glycosyltransferase [Alphaproteobacteria bacterium]|nr:glycosyltransferase [Alphaproteobacteria bacterium]
MLALLTGVTWAVAVSWLLTRVLRQFRAYREALLLPLGSPVNPAAISVIVPARNEIENIENCLAGLEKQTCLSRRASIIIVDDDSQDGTMAAIESHVRRDPRIRLVAAGTLPEGWVGKPRACWRGALLAEGDWLCFIDADVRAAPELVAAAATTAEAQRIDMLSIQPRQEFNSFWERVIMPAGLLMIACAKRCAIGDEAVNGQVLLIRRTTYFQVGGHSAVRAEICEDKALAARVRQAGCCVRVKAAGELARTRMYRDLGSLWEGLSKNATEILGSNRATLTAAGVAFVFGWTVLLLPIVIFLAALKHPSPESVVAGALALSGSAAVVGIHAGTASHFRLPAAFGLSFPLGYTLAACLAVHGVVLHVRGRITWKGRTYRLHRQSPQPM